MNTEKKKAAKVLQQEQATVANMISLYCRAKHGTTGGLCPDCQELLAYAHARLAYCAFMPEKPACAKCPVHCYQEAYRDKMREVMRFAGPRMLLVDPISAFRHLRSIFKKDSTKVENVRNRMKNVRG